MTVLRLLCFVGLHPRKVMAFVGSSWNPDLYVRICRECEREV
jgi:hypothetical protein